VAATGAVGEVVIAAAAVVATAVVVAVAVATAADAQAAVAARVAAATATELGKARLFVGPHFEVWRLIGRRIAARAQLPQAHPSSVRKA
jgi:hypothetical protein